MIVAGLLGFLGPPFFSKAVRFFAPARDPRQRLVGEGPPRPGQHGRAALGPDGPREGVRLPPPAARVRASAAWLPTDFPSREELAAEEDLRAARTQEGRPVWLKPVPDLHGDRRPSRIGRCTSDEPRRTDRVLHPVPAGCPARPGLAQERLTTFEAELGELSLKPGTGGVFVVRSDGEVVWERCEQGFPEPTAVKRAVRVRVAPGKSLGHSDT